MSTLLAITAIMSAVSLVSIALGVVIGRGVRIADERAADRPSGDEADPDVIPFEDDDTIEFPALPPAPAPSQHYTDPTWGRTVSADLVDMEFDSLVAFVKRTTGGWVA